MRAAGFHNAGNEGRGVWATQYARQYRANCTFLWTEKNELVVSFCSDASEGAGLETTFT